MNNHNLTTYGPFIALSSVSLILFAIAYLHRDTLTIVAPTLTGAVLAFATAFTQLNEGWRRRDEAYRNEQRRKDDRSHALFDRRVAAYHELREALIAIRTPGGLSSALTRYHEVMITSRFIFSSNTVALIAKGYELLRLQANDNYDDELSNEALAGIEILLGHGVTGGTLLNAVKQDMELDHE